MFKHIPRKNHQGSQAPSQTLQARTIAQSADSIELDFKKCFDNIPLDKAIGCVKEMGIKNFQLLRTIKHLMWTSKEYSGVGLSQGTVLEPLLANCYLTQLDTFIEQTFETNKNDTAYTENYRRHKNGIFNAARKSVANIIAMQTILLSPVRTKKSKNL